MTGIIIASFAQDEIAKKWGKSSGNDPVYLGPIQRLINCGKQKIVY
jgi:hypothetical protein